MLEHITASQSKAGRLSREPTQKRQKHTSTEYGLELKHTVFPAHKHGHGHGHGHGHYPANSRWAEESLNTTSRFTDVRFTYKGGTAIDLKVM
jgi:hypothetical protein